METDEAIRAGLILSGPVLSVVGLFFAASISANPYINIMGKAVGWSLAPIMGLIVGSKLAIQLLPSWSNWGIAFMFGWGFFLTWCAVATLAHDDTLHNAGRFAAWATPRIKRAAKQLKNGRNSMPRSNTRLRYPSLGDEITKRMKER